MDQPLSQQNFALRLALERGSFAPDLHCIEIQPHPEFLFCVSLMILLSFSYTGSTNQKDGRIHAVQKLFKPTQCWAPKWDHKLVPISDEVVYGVDKAPCSFPVIGKELSSGEMQPTNTLIKGFEKILSSKEFSLTLK